MFVNEEISSQEKITVLSVEVIICNQNVFIQNYIILIRITCLYVCVRAYTQEINK